MAEEWRELPWTARGPNLLRQDGWASRTTRGPRDASAVPWRDVGVEHGFGREVGVFLT